MKKIIALLFLFSLCIAPAEAQILKSLGEKALKSATEGAKNAVGKQITNAAGQKFGGERLCQIGISTAFISFFLVFVSNFCCQQYDGNVAGLYVVLELPGQLDAVHLRHHDITDDQVWQMLSGEGSPFHSVLGLENPIVITQGVDNVLPDVFIVFHNQ